MPDVSDEPTAQPLRLQVAGCMQTHGYAQTKLSDANSMMDGVPHPPGLEPTLGGSMCQ